MSAKNKKKTNKKKVSTGAASSAAFVRDEGKKYKLLRKIPLSLLLAFTAPLTVCFFGPFELYGANINEFSFSLGDFLPLCLAISAAVSVALFIVLLLLNGRAYDIACAVIVWLTVMLFVQRHYLNLGIDSLAGDGAGNAEIEPAAIVLNAALWLIVGAAAIFAAIWLKKKNIAPFFVGAAVVLIAVLAIQVVGFASVSITTKDLYTPVIDRAENAGGQEQSEPMVLTYENMGELSGGKNIVFFLVDRFDSNYYEIKVKEDARFFDKLDGFTYFSDYTSLYCRTYPAVASILTGKDHDYFTNESKADKFAKFYADGGKLGLLKSKGYNINLYTEDGYVYTDASVMDSYVDNTSGVDEYYIDDEVALAYDMVRFSLSQFLPHAVKDLAGYLSTPSINAHAVYETPGDMFMVNETATEDLKDRLEKTEFAKVEGEGQFTFIHLYGCHNTKQSHVENINETFDLIYYYIDQMKAMGIYEDSTIIITGDHAAALSDSKMIGAASKSDDGTRVTAMFFKKAGDSGNALKYSAAQVSQDELWDTIFESEGLTEFKIGESFYEIPEGEDRERRYFFEMYKNSKNNDLKYNRVYEYSIRGTAHDGENWIIIGETDIVK
ncbi:MAG: sulfatase-like hydrolase/transferase [Clostridia bacterium]|nr:sulfatase-like hydrolase/transferase [Clostridia bacterium]